MVQSVDPLASPIPSQSNPQQENNARSDRTTDADSLLEQKNVLIFVPDQNHSLLDAEGGNTIVPPSSSSSHQNYERRETVSSSSSSSFLVQFAKTKGPPQITFLMVLVAIGLGSTIGVVPAVMTDRFARLNHGYNDTALCSSFENEKDTSSRDIEPDACLLGSSDAQNAAALDNLISNVLTFFTSSLIGGLSDEYGRRGILILGLIFSTCPPLMLFLIQMIPSMSPWWYYGFDAATGLVNWIAIALSSLSDVLPQQFRAPGIGLLLAGFSLGISLSPVLAFVFDREHLTLISYLVVFGGLVSTILFLPETLPPEVAEAARQQRRAEQLEDENASELQERFLGGGAGAGSTQQELWRCLHKLTDTTVARILTRPIREMSILNRNYFFRLVSLLAFFSGMVSSGDQVLLVYYVQQRFGFTEQDISIILLIIGIVGLLAQGILLKPLNECIGEKLVVALCFFLGSINNIMYGIAQNKATIFAAVTISALTNMAFPTISAIKANNVDVSEQGRIQGALYSLQALASGIGPAALRFVQRKTQGSPLGSGTMFVFAGLLYLFAVAVACALPKELTNATSRESNNVDEGEDEDKDKNLEDYFLIQTMDDESSACPAPTEPTSVI